MSRQINKLSATAVKTAKPKDKTIRMADGGGLYLEIRPTGSKYWRMKALRRWVWNSPPELGQGMASTTTGGMAWTAPRF